MTRHPADILSLVSGLIVVAFGLLLLTASMGDVPMEWVGPAVAIGLGVVILIAARPGREPSHGAPEEDD
jgi:peptidoglycan/LPS O-acetylase OafA/YrhL